MKATVKNWLPAVVALGVVATAAGVAAYTESKKPVPAPDAGFTVGGEFHAVEGTADGDGGYELRMRVYGDNPAAVIRSVRALSGRQVRVTVSPQGD